MISISGLKRCLTYSVTKWLSLAVLLTTLGGCAVGGFGRTPEDLVRERAAKRWEALIAADFDSAYHYTTPSFRKAQAKGRYRNMFGNAARWTSAKVASVVCSQDACDVQVSVEMQVFVGFTKGMPSFTVMNEKWVREEGEWWYFHKL